MLPFIGCINSSIHSAHSAHAGVAGGHRGLSTRPTPKHGFLDVAEDALGGEEHAGDAGGVVGRADGTPLLGHAARVHWTSFTRSEKM